MDPAVSGSKLWTLSSIPCWALEVIEVLCNPSAMPCLLVSLLSAPGVSMSTLRLGACFSTGQPSWPTQMWLSGHSLAPEHEYARSLVPHRPDSSVSIYLLVCFPQQPERSGAAPFCLQCSGQGLASKSVKLLVE